jgi:hypothetical protein
VPAASGVASEADGRRLHNPVELARALLLRGAAHSRGEAPRRAQRVEALRHELAELRRSLEDASDSHGDEALASARRSFERARLAAGAVFPDAPRSTVGGADRAPSVDPIVERGLSESTPRPAPPGVLERIRERAASTRPPPPRAQLEALLDGVEDALLGADPDGASLERAARSIDDALEASNAGHGPALRYSTTRLTESRP